MGENKMIDTDANLTNYQDDTIGMIPDGSTP